MVTSEFPFLSLEVHSECKHFGGNAHFGTIIGDEVIDLLQERSFKLQIWLLMVENNQTHMKAEIIYLMTPLFKIQKIKVSKRLHFQRIQNLDFKILMVITDDRVCGKSII